MFSLAFAVVSTHRLEQQTANPLPKILQQETPRAFHPLRQKKLLLMKVLPLLERLFQQESGRFLPELS